MLSWHGNCCQWLWSLDLELHRIWYASRHNSFVFCKQISQWCVRNIARHRADGSANKQLVFQWLGVLGERFWPVELDMFRHKRRNDSELRSLCL